MSKSICLFVCICFLQSCVDSEIHYWHEYTVDSDFKLEYVTSHKSSIKMLTIGSNYAMNSADILRSLNRDSLSVLTVFGDSVVWVEDLVFPNLEYLDFFTNYLEVSDRFVCSDQIVRLTVYSEEIRELGFLKNRNVKNYHLVTKCKDFYTCVPRELKVENLTIDPSMPIPERDSLTNILLVH